MTVVMLAFTLQYTIIDVINLNKEFTKNLLQNPVSEEEEEEENINSEIDHLKFFNLSPVFNFSSCEILNSKISHINCRYYSSNIITAPNQPPEFKL